MKSSYILIEFVNDIDGSDMERFSGYVRQACVCRNPLDEPVIHEFANKDLLIGYIKGTHDIDGNLVDGKKARGEV